MLSRDNESIVASTPAIHAIHVVEQFHGQSSPELSIMKLTDRDEPLLQVLLRRWKRHYLGKRQRWQDRALFRSLNMAAQAAQLPAGIDATLYDHPRVGKSGLYLVYELLDQVLYVERKVGERRYVAYKSKKPRHPFPSWLYGKLYRVRCDFLHGNAIRKDRLDFTGAETVLFWVAPSLYRLALTGFLKLSPDRKSPTIHADPQSIIERAILRARKRK
jgi:hypothetical protein